MTEDIGKGIYRHIKKKFRLKVGSNADISSLKKNIDAVIHFFQGSGYIDSAAVDWDGWDGKKGSFLLKMNNPVILPSAIKLFREEGFAQHYLSRTIEAALLDFSIAGKESDDFDPTQFPPDNVVEKWVLRKK